MKKLLTFLLILCGLQGLAQSCDTFRVSGYSIPVSGQIEISRNGNDTLCWYWSRQEVIDYVNTHGGSGGFGNTTLTSDVAINGADLYAVSFQNTVDWWAGNLEDDRAYIEAYNPSDGSEQSIFMIASVGTNFAIYNKPTRGTKADLTVGGQTILYADSLTQITEIGNGTTLTHYDGIAGTVAVVAPSGFILSPNTNIIGTSSTMTAGTITISTTAVHSGSLIFLTGISGATPCATCGSLSIGTIVDGASFEIHSSLATDVRAVNWWIIN